MTYEILYIPLYVLYDIKTEVFVAVTSCLAVIIKLTGMVNQFCHLHGRKAGLVRLLSSKRWRGKKQLPLTFLHTWCHLFSKIGLKRELLGSCVRVNIVCSLIALLRFWSAKHFMKVADKRSSVVYHHLHVSLFVRGTLGDFFPTAALLFIA